MYGATDKNGKDYKPMINNYMGYYAPCYMKEYAFTAGQIASMKAFLFIFKKPKPCQR